MDPFEEEHLALVAVTTSTTGNMSASTQHTLVVDQTRQVSLGLNATKGVTLRLGQHQLQLHAADAACVVANGSQSIDVTNTSTNAVTFAIDCVAASAPATLTLVNASSCRHPVGVQVDRGVSVSLASTESRTVTVQAGSHEILAWYFADDMPFLHLPLYLAGGSSKTISMSPRC